MSGGSGRRPHGARLLLLLLAFLSAIAVADPRMKTDAQGNPVLDQFSEEGFVDCVFRIADLVETPSTYEFRMLASHNGQLVGLRVAVVKGIKAGFDADVKLDKAHVYRNGVVFHRSGPESDRLMASLSALYGKPKPAARMVDEASFTAIALHQGDLDIATDPVKIKLFGRDGPADDPEEDYYESFFNLDLKNRLVYWNEKDPDYRKPLLKGLSR
jgi:hypothetical protein